jgi:hypothetical protein
MIGRRRSCKNFYHHVQDSEGFVSIELLEQKEGSTPLLDDVERFRGSEYIYGFKTKMLDNTKNLPNVSKAVTGDITIKCLL